jgi:PST family polysaccharide transporter
VTIVRILTKKCFHLIPYSIRNKLEQSSEFSKIISNIGWLFGDKILRVGVGLFVGVWIARYLGPEQFGLMNYAIAFVALFATIANLGLNNIVVRDLVQDPASADTTMGTSFVLSVLGGFSAFCLSLLAISYVKPDDELAKFIVLLLSLLMIFKATDVVRYWFESQVQSKYVVWMENGTFLVFVAVKIILIVAEAPLLAFIWALFAEGLLVATGLMIVYALQGGQINAWKTQISRAKNLIKDSWPLILSGLTIMIYMRIDQIMLGQIMGNESVGIYSAAVKISEVWYFIPMTIVASVFPSIIEAKKQNETLYYDRLQKLYDIMVLVALTVAILMTFLSDWVVTLLFGKAYLEAGTVLSVHIWAGIFVFLGVASGKWFLIEGLQMFTFYRTLLGAVVNVGLNMLMIPKFGVIGAAYATVISYAVAAMFSDLLQKETIPMFRMKLRAFNILRILIAIRH